MAPQVSAQGPLLARDPPASLDGGKAASCDEKKHHFKCVLVGDRAVGKTSLIVSYSTNGYPADYSPTAFDDYTVIVNVEDEPVTFQLCDTAGQDEFDALRPLAYPGTDVFLACFSVVCPRSFRNITGKWIPEIRHYCPQAPVVLVGTQCDLRTNVGMLVNLAKCGQKPIPEVQARKVIEKIRAVEYVESSSLTQKNLKKVFDTAILCALRRKRHLWKNAPLPRHSPEKWQQQQPFSTGWCCRVSRQKTPWWKKLTCFAAAPP